MYVTNCIYIFRKVVCMKELLKSPFMWIVAIVILGVVLISCNQQKTNRYSACYDETLSKISGE